MPDEVDVVIVGAGAAGLGALATLKGAPLTVLVLEARNRIGGRAWTLDSDDGLPLDAGCGWLHSADKNVLVPKFEAIGFTIDRSPPSWGRQSLGREPAMAAQRAFAAAFDQFEARAAAAAASGQDQPASGLLNPGDPQNGRLNAISAYYNGAEWDQVSVLDYAAYEDTEINWRVREGYGRAIAALAEAPIALESPVSRLDRTGDRLRLATPQGTVSARAAILTAPTPILAEERLKIVPPLLEKIEAACGLPLGLANKVFLGLDAGEGVPIDGHVSGHLERTDTGSYGLRPFGRPYVEGFFGGRHALSLEAAGPGAMIDLAMDELCAIMGSDFRRRLRPLAETAWRSDPFALGSYSHACPGASGARARLAAPVEDRIFFAGEATHASFYSTAHGPGRPASEPLGKQPELLFKAGLVKRRAAVETAPDGRRMGVVAGPAHSPLRGVGSPERQSPWTRRTELIDPV